MTNNTLISAFSQPCPEQSTPLALIGGFALETRPPIQTFDMAKISVLAVWDWYQASFEADPESVISLICKELNCIAELAKSQPPYIYGVSFHPISVRTGKIDKTHTFMTLHYGGINSKLLLRATGVDADIFAPFIRKHWPDHQVSRADMAVDFDQKGIFDELSSWLLDYAKANRLKTGFVGDWANGTQGRTLNVGSRDSAVYIRLYEKGHEQISKGAQGVSLDWVRFEAEIKPQTKIAKKNLSNLAPHQCFGVSRLMRDFAMKYGGRYDAIKVTKGAAEKSSNPLHYLALQYGDLLTDYLTEQSAEFSAEVVLANLLALIVEEKSTKKNNSQLLKVRRLWARGSMWNCVSVGQSFLSPPIPVQCPVPLSHLTFVQLSSVPCVR
jgi:hypothetical protein